MKDEGARRLTRIVVSNDRELVLPGGMRQREKDEEEKIDCGERQSFREFTQI
jgi:hypothetical protein